MVAGADKSERSSQERVPRRSASRNSTFCPGLDWRHRGENRSPCRSIKAVAGSGTAAAALGLAQFDDVFVKIHRRWDITNTGTLLDRVVNITVRFR